MSLKKKITLVVVGILTLGFGFSFTKIFEPLDAEEIVVVQSPIRGKLTWHTSAGLKWQGWGKVTHYPKRAIYPFEERLRLNRAAVNAAIPLIDAAQWGMTGTLIVVKPGETACLECLYPEPPPFEELFPVIGAISCATGSLAALEAIKILSGTGQPLWGKMLTYDGYRGNVTRVELLRRKSCVCCSSK